jgi:hypothetical protein
MGNDCNNNSVTRNRKKGWIVLNPILIGRRYSHIRQGDQTINRLIIIWTRDMGTGYNKLLCEIIF